MPAFFLQSCSDDGDDIDEIFADKTWYVTGAKINGMTVNGEDLKQFYSNPYFVKFTNNSVSGAFETGSSFVGYWHADGEDRTLRFEITAHAEGNATTLSKKLYDIFINTTHYAGDANVIYFKKDGNNYLMLNTRRE